MFEITYQPHHHSFETELPSSSRLYMAVNPEKFREKLLLSGPENWHVPKNGVSRSKRLLKPHPLPRQYWGLEFRTSLTKAGDGAKCGAKFAATPCFIYLQVTGVRSE